ncbi:MAG: formylglycine-generating enzyme family protein [Chloracidobacterium sp.]|uniref:Formylglycine-generating enzyme family protein n=1 Tax=Chloracidobacterium validum TaxID=2821543 RepID=A0ABX8B9H0_9BACT|nr:formylglycine-generating enzyme family protein [Chloracidobacterium validum]QUW03581.1 formylglycine-generating enzyme family protein [Chloracidobacterium validum]
MAQSNVQWQWCRLLMLSVFLMQSLAGFDARAQERSTSVGGKPPVEAGEKKNSGVRRTSSGGGKPSRPAGPPCPDSPLLPTVTLPTEQRSTLTFETPRLDARGNVIETLNKETQRFTERLSDQVSLELVAIPGECFTMGSSRADEADENEKPPIRARVFGFYMGRTEVTQAQWRVVAGWPKIERDLPPDPSKFKGDDLPVDSITWDEAVEFCRRLTKKTGRPYRLPTEAEWEYACRAGTSGMFTYGAVLAPTLENYDSSLPYGDEPAVPARRKPTPAGSLGFNAFGLADMHGNVREWCLDAYVPRLTGTHALGAPVRSVRQDEAGQSRVIRGGAWSSAPDGCRCSIREGLHREDLLTILGFRVALSDRHGDGQPIETDDDDE